MKHSKAKPKTATAFEAHMASLPEADAAKTVAFFDALAAHCCALPRRTLAVMRGDFEKALLYYAGAGVSPDEALRRMDAANLGGFYSRPAARWYTLDDAAKIYPLSMKRGHMAVFRLSVYLKAPVVPELLQTALTFTIKRFPSFATTVKKGFFWHYLDTAKTRFTAEPDSGLPCRPLRIARSGSQSFRVMYYENRISVEFFHSLTDGTGGLAFLKTLTGEYLRLLGAPAVFAGGVLDINGAPSAAETANEFPAAGASGGSGFMDRPAVQMSGRLARTRPCRVLHFRLGAARLKTAAADRNATVTAYLLSRIFAAVRYATDAEEGEMSVQVPVNMRQYRPSPTLRNFSLYCGIRLPVTDAGDPDELIPEITRQLRQKASREAMEDMMSATHTMVRALRFVPLFVKAPAARLVYGFLGDGIFSSTLSNLGVVRLPPDMAEAVESMDFALGTAVTNRTACAMVTLGDTATLSVSKMTLDPSFEEKLYALLTADGITVRVEGSEAYED